MILVRTTRSILTVAALAVAGTVLPGCNDSQTAPTNNAPYSQTDVRIGTGADAVSGGLLTVHYTGWLYDESKPEQKGAQFDSSAGGTGFIFTVGVGQVIFGWDQGVPGMKVGGVRRLVIPPSLGYGGVRNSSIPPNATMLFEIELLAVGSPAAE